jgi:hypothetical protein
VTVSAAAGPGPGQPTAARGSAAQPLRPRADSADGGASDSALSRSAPGRPGSDAGPRRGPAPDSESEG